NHAGAARDLLDTTAKATLDGMAQLRSVVATEYKPVKPYPNTDIAKRLMQIARLIKADIGLEVAEIDYGGWDTHQNQGRGVTGAFADLAGNLADAVAAFTPGLEARLDDVPLVTLPELGRPAPANVTS